MKTILIKGAGGSVGKTSVNLFLQKGYRVIALVRNNNRKQTMPTHLNLHVEAVDLQNEAEVASLTANLLEQYQVIDAAILLAGGYAGGNLEKTRLEDIREQITLNFETAFTVAKSLYPHFHQNNKGRIILVSSQAPLMPQQASSMIAYSLSKSLLFRLAEMLNEEGKGKNIVTTVVVPKVIDTKVNRDAMPEADTSTWIRTEQVAEVLEFAVSDKADPLRELILKLYND